MKHLLRKNYLLLLAAVFCLCLTACGTDKEDSDTTAVENDKRETSDENDKRETSVEIDWRDTGVVRDSGVITRNEENIIVLVCVNAEDAAFYHNAEEKVLYDFVDYPITLESDAGEAFQSIDFSDLNGDGNSDVTMKFNDNGYGLRMVWFWDKESNQFVYQPEESLLGGDIEQDEKNNKKGNGSYSWDSELCQRNVSEFEGAWYYDEDLSATSYILIDGYGNWSYFERAAGEAEGTEMDHGTFSYSTTEASTYFADSAVYEGLSIRVFEFDEGIINWGEGTYYRME